MVVFGQSGCTRAKMVVIEQGGCVSPMLLCSGKMVLLWLYTGKVVLFGQSVCIRSKWMSSGVSGCLRKRWLYSGKVVVFVKK